MSGTAELPRPVFDTLAALLKSRSGLVIGPEKSYLLESRLAPILKQDGLRDLGALAVRLRAPGSEALARDVVEAMTTNETSFFRDDAPFRHFRDVVLPRLHQARASGAPLRIWSAAASAGQEAYSLAVIVDESRHLLGARAVEILGTDLCRAQIARAREASYTQFEVSRGLTPAILAKYFQPVGTTWRAQEKLRRAVAFRTWNLLADPKPLGRFDVIFCRNVLIYFDAPTKGLVLNRIIDLLPEDGALFLGSAETVLGVSDRLVADEVAGVFRARPHEG